MSAYRRNRKRYRERFSHAEKMRYWDDKLLADPDKLPSNYAYNVPDVPKPKGGPSLQEFGLTESITEVVAYYLDRSAKKPSFFETKKDLIESFKGLLSSAFCTALIFGALAGMANSSRKPAPILEILAYIVVGVGGLTCLFWLLALIVIPIKNTIDRIRFARLSPSSGPSPLLDGKSLIETELAITKWRVAVEANNADYTRKCGERMAEIWRRHRLRVQRLMAKRELEKLQREDQLKAERFEDDNFPKLAMHPGYWTAGAADAKGTDLEHKFGKLLKAAGFSVKFTPTSGDGGIDIKAHKDGQYIAVQCKNYARKVGTPEIRDFAGALDYARETSSNVVGWLVAPNGFSESTFKSHHRPGKLELWDFIDIQELVMETYPSVVDDADEDLGVSQS
ncbi:MAG: hypothetical protein RL444_1515 [Verrucomicrobiota bacterium]|jgi:hypothetical protein